ncbi:putative F-box/FBD/LRR-repeat protein [Citrus sinensis]|uniref:F-box/FBD/LRR-repeat protein n=1 Tax=Citrus sinensis TaxID=2711 RepID=A0ACB8MCL6_CITSI|nr:putative F-box/FBD/LRR-repeat protein [Citrus sinensis]
MVVCLENPKCREDDGDRLCSLPEPVIHQIFSFMETIDVVRASAVSQKWSLKSLTLDNFGGDESGNYKVKIACPNLVSFNFLASWAPDFAFEDLDSLQNAFIFFDIIDRDERDNESCHILSKLLNELCEVKALKLSTAFLRFHFVLEERGFIPNSFNYLKSLVLSVSMADWVVPSIISLLNCSPNLEALTIYFEGDCDDWKISNKSIFCLTCHLKTVELIHVAGDENELELVRFLLKNGHVLKKLSFSWMEDVENRKEIISRIMKLPRSSSNVALEFLEPKPHDDFLKY